MTLLARIFFLLLLLVTSAYSGQNPRPPTHFEDYGACPFECCTYRRWSVNADTVLYKQRDKSSGVAFRVKKGDHVIGLTGVVITLKVGKAIIKKATTIGITKRKIRVNAGDVLYLLHYEGEGIYKIWFRGRIYENEMPTAPGLDTKTPIAQREEFIHVVSEPDYIWWVKVKNRLGRIGWSKEDKNFGDMDACG